MNSTCMAFGAAAAAVVLALVPSAPAGADEPSPTPTQAQASISAEAQVDAGPAAQSITVSWMFSGGGAPVPVPTNESLVIDARDLAGIASVETDDPRCTMNRQVLTCASTDGPQNQSVEFTLRADKGAALGISGSLTYTLTADHAAGAAAKTKVVVGTPNLVVGRLPDMTHAKGGSRFALPLRLRNTGDVATDRRVVLSWEAVGGLVFDRKFSNCAYGEGDDPTGSGSRTSVTCVFPATVAAGAEVQLSRPLTATVGERVLTAVVDYSVGLLKPGEQPGGGSERGAGPALALVRGSGTGDGFERGAEGRFTITTDNFADLAADATTRPGRKPGEWTLDISAVNHGPASVYGIDGKPIALVDIELPKGVVASGLADMEQEDDVYGPCLLRVGGTGTAPFDAGHRQYVCTVPSGIAAGRSQRFELRVRTSEAYGGAKGTATVRPGPAGALLHDPDPSNDGVTFTFGTSGTPPAATVSGDVLSDTGVHRGALVATAAAGFLLCGVVLVVRRRRRFP